MYGKEAAMERKSSSGWKFFALRTVGEQLLAR